MYWLMKRVWKVSVYQCTVYWYHMQNDPAMCFHAESAELHRGVQWKVQMQETASHRGNVQSIQMKKNQ